MLHNDTTFFDFKPNKTIPNINMRRPCRTQRVLRETISTLIFLIYDYFLSFTIRPHECKQCTQDNNISVRRSDIATYSAFDDQRLTHLYAPENRTPSPLQKGLPIPTQISGHCSSHQMNGPHRRLACLPHLCWNSCASYSSPKILQDIQSGFSVTRSEVARLTSNHLPQGISDLRPWHRRIYPHKSPDKVWRKGPSKLSSATSFALTDKDGNERVRHDVVTPKRATSLSMHTFWWINNAPAFRLRMKTQPLLCDISLSQMISLKRLVQSLHRPFHLGVRSSNHDIIHMTQDIHHLNVLLFVSYKPETYGSFADRSNPRSNNVLETNSLN